MADFLASLVDRARGRAQAIERRRPTPFEPLATASGWDARGQTAAIDADVEIDRDTTNRSARERPDASSDLSVRVPPAPRAPTETTQSHERTSEFTRLNLNPPLHEAASKPATFQRDDRASMETDHRSTPPAATRVIREVVERIVEPGREARHATVATPASLLSPAPAPSARVAPPERQAIAKVRPEPALEARPQSIAEAKPAAPAVSRAKTSKAEPRTAPTANPTGAPDRSNRIRSPLPLDQPPLAPTIQVTIGRIEVRATPAPEPAKPPRAKGPALTLDAYLRSRSGGAR